jgi:hypothetical protein
LKAVPYLKNHQNNFAPLAYTTLYLKYVKRMMEILYPIIYLTEATKSNCICRKIYLSMEGALPSIISSNLKGSGRATLLVKKQVVL